MKSQLNILILVPFVLGLMALGLYVQKSIWDECRSGGHSRLYCMALISHK